MATYEEALKTARGLKANITKCLEFGDAWLFKSDDDEHKIGGDGPVIILKATGKDVNQTYYYDELGGGRDVDLRAEFDVK